MPLTGAVCLWERDEATLRITSHGGTDADVPNLDTDMARMAHENALRWAIAYVRENPYDTFVPKPHNSPTFIDRPLYAQQMFDASGNFIAYGVII